MFDTLSATAWGIIAFAVMVVVGAVTISNLSAGVANCPTFFTNYNTSSGLCVNSTGGSNTVPAATPAQTGFYLGGQLGSTSGGLASYTPAVIAIVIGVLFLSYFGFSGKKNY